MSVDWTAYILGPVGGLCGLFYGLGCATGWKFHEKTVSTMLLKQIEDLKADLLEEKKTRRLEKEDCDAKIARLELRVQNSEDQRVIGLENQLRQIRESTNYLVERGQIKPAVE